MGGRGEEKNTRENKIASESTRESSSMTKKSGNDRRTEEGV